MEGRNDFVELAAEAALQEIRLLLGARLALLHAQDDADAALGHAAPRDGAQRHGDHLDILLVLRQHDPVHDLWNFEHRCFRGPRAAARCPAACEDLAVAGLHGAPHACDGAAAEDDHVNAVGEHQHGGHKREDGEDLLRIRPGEANQQDGQPKDKQAGDGRTEPHPDPVQPEGFLCEALALQYRRDGSAATIAVPGLHRPLTGLHL
mmetsp:Transcript_120320/g.335702  ORF Transcript_120320/g.335702 Transcript_120320/m.335702 type:complete len:206 (-) Transcript_120320:648-1265(-)